MSTAKLNYHKNDDKKTDKKKSHKENKLFDSILLNDYYIIY